MIDLVEKGEDFPFLCKRNHPKKSGQVDSLIQQIAYQTQQAINAPGLEDILEKRSRTRRDLGSPKSAFLASRVVYRPVGKETRSENPHVS
jgi:hypothetical protein